MVRVVQDDGRWVAYDAAAEVVGTVRIVVRPDGRTFASLRDCHDDAYAPLLAQAAAGLTTPLYVSVPAHDEQARQRLRGLGFVVDQVEYHYRVPVDPARFRLSGLAPPPGIVLVSAAEADLDRLRRLDDTLRGDTPGTDGWRWGRQEFRDETFSDGFDPATYQVAVVERTGAYVGLVRVWLKEAGPRLGFIGVVPQWRRTRVTYALLSTVCGELHRRGHAEMSAEVSATNRASLALARRAGAVRVGHSYQLMRL